MDVADVVGLTQHLVRIDSSNPNLGSIGGPGEVAIAKYIQSWLRHRDIETHWIEETSGRPSVIGIVRGSGGGKSLMFNGHIDTVTLLGYSGDALDPRIADGKLFGRGSADMKSGLAAAMIAVSTAKGLPLKGDVILAAVADEEGPSIGTEQVIQAGWRADAAIVPEPTDMAVVTAHKGFVLFEIEFLGVAAHGSRADLGVDAICKAGYFLVELDKFASELSFQYDVTKGSELDAPNIHAGVIRGGEEVSSYPARCVVRVERRTVRGETPATTAAELTVILERLKATIPGFEYNIRVTSSRPPHAIDSDHEFVKQVAAHAERVMNVTPTIKSETYWTDMALLAEVGIPGVIWGPRGFGLHSKEEWVEVKSLEQLSEAYVNVMKDYCA